MRMNGGQYKKLCCFPYIFIACVMPGQLPKVAFSGRIKPFQITNLFFVFLKSEYSTKLYQLMSINKGQSLHLTRFQHKFILHVMPGH